MEGPSCLTIIIGLALGLLLAFLGLWNGLLFFDDLACTSGDEECRCIDFKKAIQPCLITVGGTFLAVWAAPNIYSAIQGGIGGNGGY